jgi:hypothetical protein
MISFFSVNSIHDILLLAYTERKIRCSASTVVSETAIG